MWKPRLIINSDGDKRRLARSTLLEKKVVPIELMGVSTLGTVIDVSFGGVRLQLSENIKVLENTSVSVNFPKQLFQGQVASTFGGDSDQKIGIRLGQVNLKEIDLNRIESTWDKISDVETVKKIYDDLVLKGPEALLEFRQSHNVRCFGYPVKIIGDDIMVCEFLESPRQPLKTGSVRCIFELFQTAHAFDTSVEGISGQTFSVKLPSHLARLLRRDTFRVGIKSENVKIKLKLSSRGLIELDDLGEMFDVSEHGFSVASSTKNLGLPRDLYFDEAVININDVVEIIGKATVKSFHQHLDTNLQKLGFHFETIGEPYLTAWHNLILRLRYPGIDYNYHRSDHSKIWTLFDRSDYMNLKEAADYDYLLDITEHTWVRLRDMGTALSKRAVIREDNNIIGHIQLDKFYPNTWCVHHLALDPAASRFLAGDIYALTTDVLISEKGKYLINFTEASKAWNQRSYYDFIREYRFPEHNELKEYHIYEAFPDREMGIVNNPSLQFTECNHDDYPWIARFIQERVSSLEFDACSIESDPGLEELKERFLPYGLTRYRKFVSCHLDGKLVGVARIEVGSDGTNVVGIQDMIYLYFVESERELVVDPLLGSEIFING